MADVNGTVLQAYSRALSCRDVDPRRGLPDEVFGFALQIVPMVNVDLLVRDDSWRILWAWREDAFGTGWHLPGGIIRFRERWQSRIAEVARIELGAEVSADEHPCRTLQLLDGERGHFLTLLFRCTLRGELQPPRGLIPPDAQPEPEQLCWFDAVPQSLYPAHETYRNWIRTLDLAPD